MVSYFFTQQGGLRASLFVFCASLFFACSLSMNANANNEAAINQAIAKNLENSPVWKSLLHLSGGKPHVLDPSFLLTSDNFSLRSELLATINAFYSDESAQFLCRFPSRYLFLQQHIELPPLNLDSCQDLMVFMHKAPAEKIALIYASENISQPSSMMGHLFLKISGENENGKHVEHAISFYTDAQTINIPKLMYDSMIKGKKGYFTLSPYAEKVELYLHNEQRNLWEYELSLSDFQRQLIQLHLYELKQTEFKYFFQSYNCATVISFVASLAIPELREPDSLWVTPLDVVKKVDAFGSVQKKYIQASDRWSLRMLHEQLPESTAVAIKQSIDNQSNYLPVNPSPDVQFLIEKTERHYNNFRFEKGFESHEDWLFNSSSIEKGSVDDMLFLNLSEYKNPLKTPQDSQVYLGGVSIAGESYLRMGIVPASHKLEDDNRQYFSETGLSLAAISLLTNVRTGDTQLEKFELYSVESLAPYDLFTGGISGRFAIGIEPQFEQDLDSISAGFVRGALGYTYALTTDVDVYGMVGVGVGHAASTTYLYASPEIGIVVREVFDMKSILSFRENYNQLGSRNWVNCIEFTQTKYISNNFAVFFHANRNKSDIMTVNSYDLTLKKYF